MRYGCYKFFPCLRVSRLAGRAAAPPFVCRKWAGKEYGLTRPVFHGNSKPARGVVSRRDTHGRFGFSLLSFPALVFLCAHRAGGGANAAGALKGLNTRRRSCASKPRKKAAPIKRRCARLARRFSGNRKPRGGLRSMNAAPRSSRRAAGPIKSASGQTPHPGGNRSRAR